MNTNLKTRDVSVPFISNPFGQFDGNGIDETQVFFFELGYIADPLVNRYLDGPYTLPSNMNVTELYLTVRMTAPDDQDLSFRVAIGRWSHDYIPLDKADYTEYEIGKSHQIITGVPDKFTVGMGESILIDGLNLVKALPKVGDSNYKNDAFVLVLYFDETPVFDLSGTIEVFVNGSSVLGVK
jgi:hypothetical protein